MSTDSLRAGSVFGRDFRVLERLAAGGMGTVYVALQLSTGKRRALKVMHAQYEGDERARQRFIQEARVGASIDSDHIVEMVGAGVDEATSTPWIAMELLVGSDLKTVIAERGALPREDVLEIGRQLCHALGEAHRMGLVHRDLKPENIFLAKPRREGVQFTVKLLDFGIAKLVQESQTTGSQTQAVGSPRWMAPEQAERGGRIVPATDVWALGLIVFNLLTGRCYWRTANSPNPSVMQQLAEVIIDPIDPPSTRAAEYGLAEVVPPGFDAWFARCVVREVGERYPDAAEAMAALAKALVPEANATARRSTKPSLAGRSKADFRLDLPLPPDTPHAMGEESARPAASRDLTPEDPKRARTPPPASRDVTPPRAAETLVHPRDDAPANPPRRAALVFAAASLTALGVVLAVALTRPRSPTPSPAAAFVAVSRDGGPGPRALADGGVVSDAGSTMVITAEELRRDDAGAPAVANTPVNPGHLRPRLLPDAGAGAANGAQAVRDDLSYQESVRTLLRSRQVDFVGCYERGTEHNANVSGNLDIAFQVGTDGRASGVSTRGLDAAPEVGRCIAEVIRSANFAAPPSGTSAIVHSLHFSRRFEVPPEAAPTPPRPPEPEPAPAPEPTGN